MPRIDARIKTSISGKASCQKGSRNHTSNVLIKEISLGGARIQGLPDCHGHVKIETKLLNGNNIELEGEIVRVEKDAVGLEFNCADMKTLKILWEGISDEILTQRICPYCGSKKSIPSTCCSNCTFPLNFDASDYLKEHFRNTFLERVKRRVDKLDTDHLGRVIKNIDMEILKTQGMDQEDEFVGTSPMMLEVFSMIRKVAPTDVNVLILGESGTGKELTAKAIHERSSRKDKPFIAINSAAIPESLLESELFGFEKGAFTGAQAAKRGKFEQAHGGTIFLDEIGDLPVNLQAKLLRFLEDRIVERIGAKSGKKVDVRIITATNCELKSMVLAGLFRNDLYYRLDGFTLNLPPLRSRGEDKILLARYIANKIAQSENAPVRSFSLATLNAIRAYDWPGNVRELINKIRRGLLMATGDEIQPVDMDLLETIKKTKQKPIIKESDATQKEIVKKVLQEHNYVVTRSAKELGISRPSLYSLMKKHNISKIAHPGDRSP